jgi:hypothetical protein
LAIGGSGTGLTLPLSCPDAAVATLASTATCSNRINGRATMGLSRLDGDSLDVNSIRVDLYKLADAA